MLRVPSITLQSQLVNGMDSVKLETVSSQDTIEYRCDNLPQADRGEINSAVSITDVNKLVILI